MGIFDNVACDYPLPDPRHQDLEFQTKDLERVMGRYTITRDGRLIRHARPSPFMPAPVRDVEWPIHGDIRIYDLDPDSEQDLIEYAVRFAYGRVDSIRRVRLEGGAPREALPMATEGLQAPTPEVMGRPLTVEEFTAFAPEKLELAGGRIPGGEKLVVLLLASLGLRRVSALVGHEAWKSATEDPALFVTATNGAESEAAEPPPPSRGIKEAVLLRGLRERHAALGELLERSSNHWGFEDPIYRFYHQSFKVYWLQQQTDAIVRDLSALVPGQPLNPWFREIVARGTGKQFSSEHNPNWTEVTRPILEAFFHARFFLEMAVRYSHLESPPRPLPSGYAALLYLYGLR
jgi:hypothetical protein